MAAQGSSQNFSSLNTKKVRVGDTEQIEHLVLLEDRPTDIALAYEAAVAQGDAFAKSFQTGLDLIDGEIAAAVRKRL